MIVQLLRRFWRLASAMTCYTLALGCNPQASQPASAEIRGTADLDLGQADYWPGPDFLEEVGRVMLRPNPPHVLGKITDIAATDSLIWVADAIEANVKLFDRSGRHLATYGRAGDGPGEFREASALALLENGQLAVLDRRRGRVSIWLSPEAEPTGWRHGMAFANSMSSLPGTGLILAGLPTGVAGAAPVRVVSHSGFSARCARSR
jgi:hypothetical protein